MFTYTQSDNSKLSEEEIVAVASLVNSVWPHPEKTLGVIMIYPKDYTWPDGSIDLNGPGY